MTICRNYTDANHKTILSSAFVDRLTRMRDMLLVKAQCCRIKQIKGIYLYHLFRLVGMFIFEKTPIIIYSIQSDTWIKANVEVRSTNLISVIISIPYLFLPHLYVYLLICGSQLSSKLYRHEFGVAFSLFRIRTLCELSVSMNSVLSLTDYVL